MQNNFNYTQPKQGFFRSGQTWLSSKFAGRADLPGRALVYVMGSWLKNPQIKKPNWRWLKNPTGILNPNSKWLKNPIRILNPNLKWLKTLLVSGAEKYISPSCLFSLGLVTLLLPQQQTRVHPAPCTSHFSLSLTLFNLSFLRHTKEIKRFYYGRFVVLL